jgi:hypothetical protein
MYFAGERACDLLRPGCEDQAGNLLGEIVGADDTGERGHHDEKREHRHQYRQRNMAGNRPAIVTIEAIESVYNDSKTLVDRIQSEMTSALRGDLIWP